MPYAKLSRDDQPEDANTVRIEIPADKQWASEAERRWLGDETPPGRHVAPRWRRLRPLMLWATAGGIAGALALAWPGIGFASFVGLAVCALVIYHSPNGPET